MRSDNLDREINNALTKLQDLKQYLNYPPIYNSKLMLDELREFSTNTTYLRANLDRLNIGLLAAKSLDNDKKFFSYSTLLHNVWAAVLTSLNQPFLIPTSGSQLVAYSFYQKHYPNDQNRIASHIQGIDFNFPVSVVTINADNILGQWKLLTVPQGDYYADINRNVKPTCLGISDFQQDIKTNFISRRIEHQFKLTSNTDVLKSVAAAVLDTWSVKLPAMPVQTTGGCNQYFNANDKNYFQQIYPKP